MELLTSFGPYLFLGGGLGLLFVAGFALGVRTEKSLRNTKQKQKANCCYYNEDCPICPKKINPPFLFWSDGDDPTGPPYYPLDFKLICFSLALTLIVYVVYKIIH